MWKKFIQEEIREETQRGDQKKKFEKEINLTLVGKGKLREKKGLSDGLTSKGEKKINHSNFFFACHQPRHFVN